METVQKILHSSLTFLLDLVLPQDPAVRELELMEASDMHSKFKRTNMANEPWIYSIFDYKDERVEKAVWELKYRGNQKIAETFARVLTDTFLEEMSEFETFKNFTQPIFIPIPLSIKRRRERGFNQSELVLTKLKNHLPDANIRFDLLQKIKNTKPQTSFSKKADRLNNLKNVFTVTDAQSVRGKNIILFDDVSTTGSTLREARNTLLSAGAREVIAITIAH